MIHRSTLPPFGLVLAPSLLLVACLLTAAGCAHAPDPAAPVVLADPIRVTCPEPKARQAPPELVQPLGLEAPAILKAGEGDYGIARGELEKLVTALRAAAGRINQWRAWARPTR